MSPEAWEELWSELANEVTRRASALAESVDAAASTTRDEREQAFALSRDMRLVAMLHGAVSADRGAELIERARRLLGRPPCAVEGRVEDDDEDETTIPRRVNHLLEHESAEGAARSERPVAGALSAAARRPASPGDDKTRRSWVAPELVRRGRPQEPLVTLPPCPVETEFLRGTSPVETEFPR